MSRTSFAFTASLGVIAACTSPPPRHPSYRLDGCEAFCDHAQHCGSDRFGCVQHCKYDADWEPVYERREYVHAFAACIRQAPCRSTARAACEASARWDIRASAAASGFCAKYVEKDRVCGITTTPEECGDAYKVLVDEVFPALEPCLDEPCDRYRRCILGVYANGPR